MLTEIDPRILKPIENGRRQWFQDRDENLEVILVIRQEGWFVLQVWLENQLLEWDQQKNLIRTGQEEEVGGAFTPMKSTTYKFHSEINHELLERIRQRLASQTEAIKIYPELWESLLLSNLVRFSRKKRKPSSGLHLF